MGRYKVKDLLKLPDEGEETATDKEGASFPPDGARCPPSAGWPIQFPELLAQSPTFRSHLSKLGIRQQLREI